VTTLTREVLQVCLDDAEIDDDAVRWGYSGRFMYGKTCFGFVGDLASLSRFLLTAGRAYVQTEWDADYSGSDGPAWNPDELVNVSTDGMGIQTIFYWPRISFDDLPTRETT
jgi:hypothetical protein